MTGQPLTEKLIQSALKDALRRKDFDLLYHAEFSLGSVGVGFPDLIAIRRGDRLNSELVAIEVKGPKGKLRPQQETWISHFEALPGCVMAVIVGPEPSDRWIGYEDALTHIIQVL